MWGWAGGADRRRPGLLHLSVAFPSELGGWGLRVESKNQKKKMTEKEKGNLFERIVLC